MKSPLTCFQMCEVAQSTVLDKMEAMNNHPAVSDGARGKGMAMLSQCCAQLGALKLSALQAGIEVCGAKTAPIELLSCLSSNLRSDAVVCQQGQLRVLAGDEEIAASGTRQLRWLPPAPGADLGVSIAPCHIPSFDSGAGMQPPAHALWHTLPNLTDVCKCHVRAQAGGHVLCGETEGDIQETPAAAPGSGRGKHP